MDALAPILPAGRRAAEPSTDRRRQHLLPGVEGAAEWGAVSTDGVGRENPAGCWRGGVFVGEVSRVVGMVPVAGDAFDVMFRANVRNVRMLKRWMDKQPRA